MSDKVEQVTKELWDFVCSGGGDASTIKWTAERIAAIFADPLVMIDHPPCEMLAPGTTKPRTFTFRFSREVTETEYVMREIEAPNVITAQGLANAMASDFNHTCPDDIAESGGADFGDWEAELAS